MIEGQTLDYLTGVSIRALVQDVGVLQFNAFSIGHDRKGSTPQLFGPCSAAPRVSLGSQIESQAPQIPFTVGPVLSYFYPEFKVDSLTD